jgi:hypothetical protein
MSRALLLARLLPLLPLADPVAAAVFEVGPDGTYATVQAGVDAAVLAGGENEVRVQAGTYGKVKVRTTFDSGSLTLTGGWNASFDARDTSPLSTVLDGGGVGPVVDLDPLGNGTLILEGFTVRNGLGALLGGGVAAGRANHSFTGTIRIQNNLIESNSAADGGGIHVAGQGTPSIIVENNVIRQNRAFESAPGVAVLGGGLSVRALGSASFSVRENVIEDNEIATKADLTGSSQGGGVFLKLQEGPFVDFSDNVVRNNRATGPGNNLGDGLAVAIFFGCPPLLCTTGTIEARRNVFLDNVNEAAGSIVTHVQVISDLDGTLRMTDSIVAGGDGMGILYFARQGGTIELTNLTVVDHLDAGITESTNDGSVSIANTIVFGNTPDLDAPDATTVANLVGIDPVFVDPLTANYQLQEGSPAIDVGSNAPPGGLGPLDVDGNPRVVNGIVDVGAIEFVPEPGAVLLQTTCGAALLALARWRRRGPRARP